jgi:hypothetical protein
VITRKPWLKDEAIPLWRAINQAVTSNKFSELERLTTDKVHGALRETLRESEKLLGTKHVEWHGDLLKSSIKSVRYLQIDQSGYIFAQITVLFKSSQVCCVTELRLNRPISRRSVVVDRVCACMRVRVRVCEFQENRRLPWRRACWWLEGTKDRFGVLGIRACHREAHWRLAAVPSIHIGIGQFTMICHKQPPRYRASGTRVAEQ